MTKTKVKRISSRSWQLIVPLDFPVERIKEKVKLISKNYYFIKHDKDLDDFGEFKKEHWHFLFTFSSPRCLDTLVNDFKDFVKQDNEPYFLENSFEKIQSITGAKKYLCHFEHPNKAQYSYAEVETNDLLFPDLFREPMSQHDEFNHLRDSLEKVSEAKSFYDFLGLFEIEFNKVSNPIQKMTAMMSLRRYYQEYKENKPDFEKVWW